MVKAPEPCDQFSFRRSLVTQYIPPGFDSRKAQNRELLPEPPVPSWQRFRRPSNDIQPTRHLTATLQLLPFAVLTLSSRCHLPRTLLGCIIKKRRNKTRNLNTLPRDDHPVPVKRDNTHTHTQIHSNKTILETSYLTTGNTLRFIAPATPDSKSGSEKWKYCPASDRCYTCSAPLQTQPHTQGHTLVPWFAIYLDLSVSDEASCAV